MLRILVAFGIGVGKHGRAVIQDNFAAAPAGIARQPRVASRGCR